MNKNKFDIRNLVQQTAFLATILLIWEGACRFFAVPDIVLPTPSAILISLADMLQTREFYGHMGITVAEILMGFVLGAVGGIGLGMVIGLWPTMYRLLYPYIIAFETMPKVAIAPIIVIWAGYGMTSKVIVTALIAFFPLLVNTVTGLRSAPRDHIDMLVASTASRWQVFHMVQVKHALPQIFTGLDIAIVLSVIGAIVGEFVGAKAGLGYLILQYNFSFNMAGTFGVLFVLSAVGIVLHRIVAYVHAKVVFWVEYEPITHGA